MSYLLGLAHSASHHYKTYSIPKRSGGLRMIHHPSRQLKAVQRWLLANLLESLPVHRAAVAYRPRLAGTLAGAKLHAPRRYLLRMDLEEFFPSIVEADIRSYIGANRARFKDWDEEDLVAFCAFVCRHGRLTIGAPTSPSLSNIVTYELDEQLASIANRLDFLYSRYADDLMFSSNTRGELRSMEAEVARVCASIPYPKGLRVNLAKTRHSSRRRTRRVTGLILGSDGRVHVGRKTKRRIRAQVHRWDSLSPTEKGSLAGWIAYAIGIEPDLLNSLVKKYGWDRVNQARHSSVTSTA